MTVLNYATRREDLADATDFLEHFAVSLEDSMGSLRAAQRGLEWATGRSDACAELMREAEALAKKARGLMTWVERGCNEGERP